MRPAEGECFVSETLCSSIGNFVSIEQKALRAGSQLAEWKVLLTQTARAAKCALHEETDSRESVHRTLCSWNKETLEEEEKSRKGGKLGFIGHTVTRKL